MIKAFLLGIIFGVILQRSRVNTYEKIGGFAMLKDFTVPKILFTAIGIGSILLFIEIQLGYASFHLKPLLLTGIITGGIIFGIGMALLGYCPGTLIVSVGEGALDALIGIAGGLSAGLLYIHLYPQIKPLLGPDLGNISLYSTIHFSDPLIVLSFGLLMIGTALFLNGIDKSHVK